MTTRKQPRPAAPCGARLALLAALALGGGCATPGPLHVYSLAPGAAAIADDGANGRAEAPSFLEPADELTGFAYDPFTDHFFLRLAPGNKIRVVDRPARKVKREFEIAEPELRGGGDVAVRPRDGHLFFVTPRVIVETTRLGKPVRRFTLAQVDAPAGLALDTRENRLLALAPDGTRVTVHDPTGAQVGELRLGAPVTGGLAFDSEGREYYALLRDRRGELGVFDENGRLLRTQPAAGGFVDVGPRSFVRVF